MNKTNCPNCGAPIIHSYTYNCLYCRTLLNSNVNKIMDTKNKEIRDFEIISIEESQMFFGIDIFIKCKIREIPIMSEFNDDNCSPYASVVMPSNLNTSIIKTRENLHIGDRISYWTIEYVCKSELIIKEIIGEE